MTAETLDALAALSGRVTARVVLDGTEDAYYATARAQAHLDNLVPGSAADCHMRANPGEWCRQNLADVLAAEPVLRPSSHAELWIVRGLSILAGSQQTVEELGR